MSEEVEMKNSKLPKFNKILYSSLNNLKGFIFLVVDDNYRYLYFNSCHEELIKLKYNKKPKIGDNILDYITIDRDKVKVEYNYGIALSGEPFTVIEEYGAGNEVSVYEIEYNPIFDENNKVIGASSLARDITIQKRIEDELRISEERYKLATDASDNGIWDWWVGSEDVYYSDKWKAQIGYAPDELGNKFQTWLDHLHPDELEQKQREVYQFLETPKKYFITEFRFRHKDGSYRWIRNKSAAVIGNNGKVIRMFGAHADITIQKRAEVELEKALKKAEMASKQKNYFMANMSHEIRTPMNGIIGFSKLLKNPQLSEETKNMYLDIIDGNSKQLLTLIDDIIDISKIEADEISIVRKDCNINKLLVDLKEIFSQQLKVKEKVDVSLELKIENSFIGESVYTDIHRLEQILTNLLSNSIKFTHKGFIKFGYELEDGFLEFFVDDTGIGIPKDKQNIIFERFRQSSEETAVKYGGTGLGLAICKGLVEKLGGKIWLRSIEGKGTRFYFNIPYIQTNSDKKSNEEFNYSISKSKLKNLTIILAEDEFLIFEYFKIIFEPYNIKLLWAKNGEEAVELYKINQDADFILMDVRMPVLDGYSAAQEILKINNKAKIIAQTAFAMPDERERCLKCGCIGHVTKPVDERELFTELLKNLDR